MFAKGGRTVEDVPPTLDALKQHIKRSAFPVIKWSQCLIKNPCSSLSLGWQATEAGYFPIWTLPNNPGCTLGHKQQINALEIFAWFQSNNILCPRPLIVPIHSTSSIFVNFAAEGKTLHYDITRHNDVTK